MNRVIEGQLAETVGALSTNFYTVFEKKSMLSFQPFDLLFETQSRKGEFMIAKIPNRAQRIINMFLKIDNPRDLEIFEFMLDGVTLYSFTGEYIYLHNELRRQQSKDRIGYLIIPIAKYMPILENTEVRIKLNSNRVQLSDVKLTVDWCFDKLPTDGDYIINQVQTFYGDLTTKIKTNFYNIVKELIFCIQNPEDTSLVYPDVVTTMSLNINGYDKFNDTGMYFRYIQPMEYHTNAPGVYLYSFCLVSESDLPTGGINMSMINNQIFTINTTSGSPKVVRIYALSYNVLRIKDNKAKILYPSI